MNESLDELEAAYERAEFNSGHAMMFAPDEAFDRVLDDQENAYNQFIDSIKISTPEERNSILQNVLASKSLIVNAKLAIVKEVLELQGEYRLDNNGEFTK